jgi:hypothetical protein
MPVQTTRVAFFDTSINPSNEIACNILLYSLYDE